MEEGGLPNTNTLGTPAPTQDPTPTQSTIPTQSTQPPPPGQPQPQQPQQPQVIEPIPTAPPLNPDGTPVKRKPGRPKGSGKKQQPGDPETPKIKRPVGRPRKDGLPAGSVGAPRRPVGRPRKRPPGQFASGPPPGEGPPPIQPNFGAWPAGAPPPPPFSTAPAFSISAPPMGSLARDTLGVPHHIGAPPGFALDPSLDTANWAHVLRTNPDAFLSSLLASLAAPNPVSAAGSSVEEAFKSHLVSLAPVQPKDGAAPSAIPSLYSILKTFWLPSSPAYFALTASTASARTPSEHRFLYWDPQPLVFNGIACTYCTGPLINRGRIKSGPIKVYDLGRPFFIIACEYVCSGAGCAAQNSGQAHTFSSVDWSVLQALPEKLRDEFPAMLLHNGTDIGLSPNVWNWKAMGVSKGLWDMVKGCLRVGAGRDAILQVIKGIQEGVPDDWPMLAPAMPVPETPKHEVVEEGAGGAQMDGDADGEEEEEEEEPADAYANAWAANSVQGEPVAGPSHTNGQDASASPSGTPASASAAPLVYPPAPPAAPYAQYPYSGYPLAFYQPAGPAGFVPYPGADTKPTIQPGKRPYEGTPETPNKRQRHCCKCGSPECKGKGGRAFCSNACQDCGKLECKGRNSKRPDKTCSDAWT